MTGVGYVRPVTRLGIHESGNDKAWDIIVRCGGAWEVLYFWIYVARRVSRKGLFVNFVFWIVNKWN